MEKYKKLSLNIAIVMFSVLGAYASFELYNYYNVVARAVLGLVVFYLLYKTLIAPNKNTNWLFVRIETYDAVSLVRGLASVFFLSVAFSLSLLSIVNLLSWLIKTLQN
jgi:hypothetical protein